jgi:hypothetical protein
LTPAVQTPAFLLNLLRKLFFLFATQGQPVDDLTIALDILLFFSFQFRQTTAQIFLIGFEPFPFVCLRLTSSVMRKIPISVSLACWRV